MPVQTLTAQFCKSVPVPTSGRVEYWDAATLGLCLRISSSGKATWSFRYRPREAGKAYERVTLGPLENLTLADARDRAARIRAEVVDGGNPQMTRRQKREAAKLALRFGTLADRYLEEYAKPNKRSWKNDEERLRRARSAFGSKEAGTITRRQIIDFLDSVKRSAPVEANRIQSILTRMFNWAVEEELLEMNPIAGLKKRAREKPKERTLSDGEIRIIWKALDEQSGLMTPDTAEALKALLLLGQRPSEIAGIRQSEVVDLEGKIPRLEIPASRMKGGLPHVVPLPAMARQVIARALARRKQDGDDGAVFASKYTARSSLTRNGLSQALRRLIDQLPDDGPDADIVVGLKAHRPTPHDFRRTAATGMSLLGIPREDRLAVLAHKPHDIHGQVYDRHERLKEKMLALSAWELRLKMLIGLDMPP